MRILYLTNGFPFPLTSGYLRHYFFIKELAARHAITLLSLVGGGFQPAHQAALAPFTERVLTFPMPPGSRNPIRKAFKGVRTMTGRLPGSGRMAEAVQQLSRQQAFDVVLFSGRHTLPAIASVQTVPVVVDICDASSVRFQGAMQHAGWLRWPWLKMGHLFMRRVERRLVHRAAHLVFASCRDREFLVSGSHRRATVVPNGVDLDYWQRSAACRGDATIVFTGAMHYPPNVDAALYLIHQILPRVRRRVPQARLWIVGRDPVEPLRKAGRQPGVTVTGFVEDVRPYLEQATVFAAPLRFGAGIQNKVLEAMAMELPVVASSVAAEGLRTEQGRQAPIQVADQPERFAQQLADQLLAAAGNPQPATEARQYVAEHFVWQQSGRRLEQILESVAGVPQVGMEGAKC